MLWAQHPHHFPRSPDSQSAPHGCLLAVSCLLGPRHRWAVNQACGTCGGTAMGKWQGCRRPSRTRAENPPHTQPECLTSQCRSPLILTSRCPCVCMCVCELSGASAQRSRMGKTNALSAADRISWPNFLYFLKLTFERGKQKGGKKMPLGQQKISQRKQKRRP